MGKEKFAYLSISFGNFQTLHCGTIYIQWPQIIVRNKIKNRNQEKQCFAWAKIQRSIVAFKALI